MGSRRKEGEKKVLDELLRNTAEEQIARWYPQPLIDTTVESMKAVIHELQVHQIELEIQNEELRKAHQYLESSRDRYIDLYDFAPVGYISLTKTGVIAELNLTAATMFGKERLNLLHKRFHLFISARDHDTCTEFLFAVWKEEKKQACELMLKRSDGTEFSAWIEGVRIENSQGPMQVRITISDITERKQLERLEIANLYHRGLIEASVDPFITINPDGKITDVNQATEEVTGYTRSDLIGTDFSGYFTEPEKARIGYRAVLQTGKIRNCPLYIRHRNGRETPVLYNASVYYDRQGIIQGIFVAARDITDQRRMEETIRETNQKLRLLTSVTRHDIFNHVAVMQGLWYLAAEESNITKIHDYFSRCQEVCKRIEATIGFTREYEKFGVEPSDWERVYQIIESAKMEISFGEVRIENLIPLNLEIYADPIIRKVFTTLMDNALRHGGHLTMIRFSSHEHAGSLAIISEDDGAGVSLSEKEYIFEQGYGRHTGVGLFLTREILSITGLSIRECGLEGKGARFEITVPAGKFRRKE